MLPEGRGARAEAIDESGVLQHRMGAALALVAQEVREVGAGRFRLIEVEGGQGEGQLEAAPLLNGADAQEARQLVLRKDRRLGFVHRGGAGAHGPKELRGPAFEGI